MTFNLTLDVILMYEKELATITTGLKAAGKVIRKYYGRRVAEKDKENWQDIVTKVDIEADRLIIDAIKSKFPEHNIFSEESQHQRTESEFEWFIDPLDGTTNFVMHIPFLAAAVGLLRKGQPVVGAVYNPLTSELFSAIKGKGAFLNGKRIYVSKNSDIKKTLINFCHKNNKQDIDCIAKVWPQLKMLGRDLRRLGSGNLDIAFVACGRNDAYFSSSKIFDIAPSLAIAEEAGCKITDWRGAPWHVNSPNIAITNGTKIHDEIIAILSTIAGL